MAYVHELLGQEVVSERGAWTAHRHPSEMETARASVGQAIVADEKGASVGIAL
jgi:hypothetical protein